MNRIMLDFSIFEASVFIYKFDKLNSKLRISVEMKSCLDRLECQLRF